MVFEKDCQVFGLLVTIQRLIAAGAVSNDEVIVFVNDVKAIPMNSERQKVDKPDWMNHEVTQTVQSYY